MDPAREIRMPTVRSAIVTLIATAVVTTGPLSGQGKVLTLDDYGPWSRITGTTLSPNGGWLAFAYEPNDGDGTWHAQSLDGARSYDRTNGSGAVFSTDSKWVGVLVRPTEVEAKRLRKAKKPIPTDLHLIALDSGDSVIVENVASFAFAKGGGHVAMRRAKSDREAKHDGTDLLVRDLTTGMTQVIGNVSEFAFNDTGRFLAYLVDAAATEGNGVYVSDLTTQRVMPVSTAPVRYAQLAWNESGTAVAALQGEQPDGLAHRMNKLVLATGVDGLTPTVTTYDPTSDTSFPAQMVLSELRDLDWNKDGSIVFLGVKEQENEPKEDTSDDDEPVANVDVWHWKDERLQSVQMVQEQGDKRHTWLAAYRVADRKLVVLEDDDMRRVSLPDRGRWAVGRNDAPYRGDLMQEGGRADYYRVDLRTGERRLIARALRRTLEISPDDEWFAYLKDGDVIAYRLSNGEVVDLSAVAGVDFQNMEFDLIAERPSYGIAGWSADGQSVLLNHRYDIWSVPLHGGTAVDLTAGEGGSQQIRFRVERLDPEKKTVDLSKPVLLSAYGEWTKRSGYYEVRKGRSPTPLIFADRRIGRIEKAKDVDRVVFTQETFEQFPDYWVSDLTFREPRQVTNANPQLGDFAWGRRVLVDYTDARDNRLQATLTLPAGFESGRRYPMLVYFYEKMSQRHHEFSMPVYDDRPHMSTYASGGYLVLMPDIVYEPGRPGSSALDDVTSAVRKVIELGYADPAAIGLQGHSWGGYESSFILTQTDMFAAVVTGAPLTNLMSMYNILYKRTGSPNGAILEWSQGRLGVSPWEDFDLYVSQSPVHHAPNISTPFLILQGTADGAVDWNQGLELYTAARRLGKQVILLSYPGEPHHLAKEENQKDFQMRMRQFFDHYLRGEPAPTWMTDGIPLLEKQRHRTAAPVATTDPARPERSPLPAR
jgi:dipeptidyl aminopeptidase/acylaminoacyl peptidase